MRSRITVGSSAIGTLDLRHRVALADGHLLVRRFVLLGVADGLDVDRHAEGRAHLVLPPVELADGGRVVVDADPRLAQFVADLPRRRDDVVALLEERQDGDLRRGELPVEAQDDALLALHVLLVVRVDEEREHRPVGAGGGLDDVRRDVLLRFLVEVRRCLR
jgi:hypothetical protein